MLPAVSQSFRQTLPATVMFARQITRS